MEVAEQVVVLNDGLIEQTGAPRELYDNPANEFVMTFVGPTNRVDEAYVRPHDVDISTQPIEGGIEAMIDRVIHLGFEVRVELTLADGQSLWAQTTRDRSDELELADGQVVWVRPDRRRSFNGGAPSPADVAA
jgi:sulfate transport system ATP-binding protein